MNLLPKFQTEFSEKTYWDKFFKQRGGRSFEWYGDYSVLRGILHKYVKITDELLVTGCGNSKLSADLYDVGFANITNIDISEPVIKMMKKKNDCDRPKMSWNVMDVFKMTYDDEKFNVVLDKGTLDALMSDESDEAAQKIERMFAEISRVMKFGGRYICISLLQSHILKALLSWFRNEGWLIRIHLCKEDARKSKESKQSNLPVFVAVFTKMKKLLPSFSPILEFGWGDGTTTRLENESEMIVAVRNVQESFFYFNQLNLGQISGDACFELHKPGSRIPRYFLFVEFWEKRKKSIPSTPFAIFIVPQGRETEWMYGNTEGRKYLAENTRCERLVIVHLNRNHSYENLDAVKNELSENILEMSPNNLPSNYQIPFWSVGEDLGNRVIVEEGTSDISGEYVVEDVEVEDKKFRRLIFLSNRNIIQSEAILIRAKSTETVNLNFLACDHHAYMIGGFGFASQNMTECEPFRVLIIGLGGGGLAMFLYKNFPKMVIDVVDIDPKMLEIATKWFGFILDKRMKVHIEDGITFIEKESRNGTQYNIVMFDVDSKETSVGISCPPKQFISKSTLDCVKKILNPKCGVFVLNLVCRELRLKESVHNHLKEVFLSAYALQVENEVNSIIYCWQQVEERECLFNHLRETLKKFNQKLSKNVGELWDIEDMLSKLKLLT